MRLAPLVLCAVLALAPCAGTAHHSWSQYDQTQTIALSGPVRELEFFNPHVMLSIEAAGRIWRVVLGSPYRMQKLGLPSASLEPGTIITVIGHPHHREADTMRAERIIIEGKTIHLRGSG